MSASEIVNVVAVLFKLGLTSDEIAYMVAAAIAMLPMYMPERDI